MNHFGTYVLTYVRTYKSYLSWILKVIDNMYVVPDQIEISNWYEKNISEARFFRVRQLQNRFNRGVGGGVIKKF